MAGKTQTRADDERLLRMLDLRDNEGATSTLLAARFCMSRGAVIGAMQRADQAVLPCACKKRENRDGGMPRRWWAQ